MIIENFFLTKLTYDLNLIFVSASNLTNSERTITDNQLNFEDFQLSWDDLGNRIRLKFTVSNFTSGNVWAGVAFSKDREMGDDDAIICKAFNGGYKIERAFVAEKNRPGLLNESKPRLGLSNMNISLKNGVLTCNITRIKASRNKKVLNARNRFYILVAKGRTDLNGNVFYHGSNRYASKLNFLLCIPGNTWNVGYTLCILHCSLRFQSEQSLLVTCSIRSNQSN
ncbi:ferric-chelate reductase 1 [Brachionus plicatilis]|uniref:Ferric-chelate reductase 1 n=1 Tax=Brachionus plicatilis TaxID=10195 RepID=A0A3M7TA53_BRAPC|nr:ferric-chelate reductase 1 [Brachionus plicatilis]